MYSPVLQSASDGSGIQCIIVLVILAVVAVVLLNLASKTKNAAPHSRTVTTSLARERIVESVQSHFPKSVVTSAFNWKPSWPMSDKLVMSGYYLTNGQGCLVMLLTGIIPGALLIRLAMGRSEQVTVDFSSLEETGQLTLVAQGLRARREVDELVKKLGTSVQPSMQAG